MIDYNFQGKKNARIVWTLNSGHGGKLVIIGQIITYGQ